MVNQLDQPVQKHKHCAEQYLTDVSEDFINSSEDKRNTFHAMRELLCYYKSPYRRDSDNLVLIKKGDGQFELHYFEFDFGGKCSSFTPPERTQVQEISYTTQQKCEAISYRVKSLPSLLSNFWWKLLKKYIDNLSIYLNQNPQSC